MSKVIGKALRNSVLQTLSGFSVTGLNFILMLVYARLLGPERFGSLVTSQAQVLVWTLLIELGLTNGLVAALSAPRESGSIHSFPPTTRALCSAALLVRLIGAALGSLFVLAYAYRHAKSSAAGWDTAVFYQDAAFLPYLFGLALQQTLHSLALYRGLQGLGMIAVCLGALGSVSFSLLLAWRGASLTELLLVQSSGALLAAAVLGIGLKRAEPPAAETSRQGLVGAIAGSIARKQVWSSLFRDSWPYALVFAAMTAWQRVDQIVAGNVLGLEAGGQYALAARLVSIPILLAASVSFVIFPDLQRIGRDAPEKIPLYTGTVLKILFRFGLLATALFLGLVAFAILPLVPRFEPAIRLLPWFSFGIWAYWMHSFAISAFWGTRRYGLVVGVHAIALAIYLGAILPLARASGIQGVALAYDLFGIVLLVAAVACMRRMGALKPDFRYWAPFDRDEKLIVRQLLAKLRLSR